MTVRRKRLLLLGVAAALVLGWLLYVIAFNHRIKALDEVPVENYGLGEFVCFDDNYAYGQQLDGFEIQATAYGIWDTAEYLAQYGLTLDDMDDPPEKICVVDVVVYYNGTQEAAIDISSFYMYGTDYYEGQNDEIYALANPQSGGATTILFQPGNTCQMTLIYDLKRDYYTNYGWAHLDDLPRTIYLTSHPVQKNIVLHP
jgi:hypothetical protein